MRSFASSQVPLPIGAVSSWQPSHAQCRDTLAVVHGKMCFKVECRPGFNYARDPHEVKRTTCGIRFSSQSLDLCLFSPVGTRSLALFTQHCWSMLTACLLSLSLLTQETDIENGAAVGEICMQEGDKKVNFILCDIKEDHHDVCHKG